MREQVRSIQYLRAVAALAVVAHHTHWTGSLGAAGVDLFFVISGFIMVHVSDREANPGSFLLARLLRIAPLYWVVTAVFAISHLLRLDHTLLSLAFWPHLNAEGAPYPVLPQAWTLNYEVFFYLLFAGSLILPRRWRTLTLTVAIGGLVGLGAFLQPESLPGQSYTSPLLLEFLAGAWLCVAFRKGMAAGPHLASALAVAATTALLSQHLQPAPSGWLRTIMWGGPAIVLFYSAVSIELSGALPRIPLKLLGDASYSIYLIQFISLSEILPALGWLPGPIATVAATGITAASGVLLYWCVERPMGRIVRRAKVSRHRQNDSYQYHETDASAQNAKAVTA